jgi:5,6-dimethylbenzimidazole synthase
MGWVSLFDPERLRTLLRMPEGSRPVAILCLGRVPAFYPRPMLEQERWAERQQLRALVMDDYWNESSGSVPNGEPRAITSQLPDGKPACGRQETGEVAAGQAEAAIAAPAPIPISR